jgi:hypothetical protein
MIRPAVLLPLFVSLSFTAALAAGVPPAASAVSAKQASGSAPEAKLSQTPAAPAPAAPQRGHTFEVNDEKGVLLTCEAPQLETDPDTDLFKGCTLAPGRTLDDVMHTFIAAIHEEQKQREKERAEWQKAPGEESAQQPAQK